MLTFTRAPAVAVAPSAVTATGEVFALAAPVTQSQILKKIDHDIEAHAAGAGNQKWTHN